MDSTWRDGLRTGLWFSLGKILVLATYGGLAAGLGLLVYDLLNHPWISLAAGMAVAAMGVWFTLYGRSCGCLARRGSPFLLGVVDGAVPCAATAGFLMYLATQSLGPISGLANGLLFGLGTSTGPLLLVCGLAPRLWRSLSSWRGARLALRMLGGMVFLVWAWLILAGRGR
jgi:hypothetical protein